MPLPGAVSFRVRAYAMLSAVLVYQLLKAPVPELLILVAPKAVNVGDGPVRVELTKPVPALVLEASKLTPSALKSRTVPVKVMAAAKLVAQERVARAATRRCFMA